MVDSALEPIPERRGTPSETISLSPSELEQLRGDTARFEAKVTYRKPSEQTPLLAYLAVSVARAVARTAPRGQDPDAAMGSDRLTAARKIEELAASNPSDAAPSAVLALKDLVHDVLRLRERAALLNSSTASAYSALNSTEHKLIELRSDLDRVLAAVARAAASPDAVLLDAHASHAARVAAAEHALSGGVHQVQAGSSDGESLRHRLLLAEQDAATARRQLQQGESEIAHLRAELAAAHQALSDTGAADHRVAQAEAAAAIAWTARDEAEARVAVLSDELTRTTEERNRMAAEATSQSEELSRLRGARRDSQALVDALSRVGELEDQLADAELRAPTSTISAELDELRAAKRDSQALADSLARVGALEEQMFAEKEQAERLSASLSEQLARAQREAEVAAKLRAEAEVTTQQVAEARRAAESVLTAARTEAAKRDSDVAASDAAARSESEALRLRLTAAETVVDQLRRESQLALSEASVRADGDRAEIAAALERQLTELESRRAAQAAEFERRLAEAQAEVVRHRDATDRLQAAAQRAADARARLAAAAAAAQVRLAAAGEEAGHDAVPTVLRGCAETLRALPPDGDGDDAPALADLEAATTAVAGLLATAQRTAELARSEAATALAASEASEQRLQHASARAVAAETRAAEAEGRCESALAARDLARAEVEQLNARLADSANALAAAQAEAAAAAVSAAAALNHARYEAAALLVRAETGERERDGMRNEGEALARELAASSDAAARLHALLHELATAAGLADDLAVEPLAACADGSAAETAGVLRHRLLSASERLPALERQLAAAHDAAAAATARVEALDRDLVALMQSRDSTQAERDGVRAEAASLQGELAATREAQAARTAELAAAREQLAVAEATLATVGAEATRVPVLGEQLVTLGREREELVSRLASEGARASAAEGAVDELLDAARAAAAAAAAALDRFGLLDAGDSRRLTRATVRLDQAEDSIAASAGLGHELLERASGQIASLADRHQAIDLERLALRDRGITLDSDLAAARATAAALEERLAAAERVAAGLPPAEARISELDSELAVLRGRLDESLRAAEAERRDATVAQAAALAEAEARSDSARAETVEAEACAAQALASADSYRLAADAAAERLAGIEAEAAARLAAVEAVIAERDATIAELTTAVDQARSERGEAVGLAARLRALDQHLAEAQRENARLAAEHAQPATADPATAAALHAAEHRARGLEAALAEERVRTEALVRSRERASADWQLRFDRLQTELTAERNRLADQETSLASARAELAGAKARLRSLTSSEPTR